MSDRAPHSGRRSRLRWLLTATLLAAVIWLVEPASVWQQLRQVAPGWVLAALLVTPLQVVMSAWRWRYTLRRLGVTLSLTRAVGEYYLSVAINQLLPGGVVGDAGRAFRHSRQTGRAEVAIHGVMIERLSGQLALFLVGGLLILFWLPLPAPPMPGLFLLPGLMVVGLLLWSVSRGPRLQRLWRAFRRDLEAALLRWPALPVQMVSSLLVMVSYLLVFWCLAMGLGLDTAVTAPGLLMALCTVLLMAMLVPLTVSGWGVREGAAALIWPLAGLDPQQGVALSVSYGVVVLVSALPGLVFALGGWGYRGRELRRRRGSPDQTACRCPD
ncbi:Uncharacterized membrane protein YbhN, UPF0104 family [Marinobacter daqiaonensis]|uniref:Uncharacterized membrane protein YbhN, UPF0104 family n=1 Tax=Marinobacter daqiaonensis TaxID=650891 RepID=A0A1I6H0K1_9GAMM|nr:lysylphosphatidylglycerol synthase transmembrane domain-containing protein [Marinobacter daqiaonensis]SFR47877.1 Uncharacterized membrane protein YbhN, UPF0104 family [Marinobacter daqiaonensis]